MARSLVWNDLSMKQIYEFNSLKSIEEASKFVQNCCKIPDEDGTNGIMLDFYFYVLSFARDEKFTPEQTSAFFSIMKRTHEHCISSPFSQLESDFAFFNDLALRHSIHRPPFSDNVFTLPQLKRITEYATNTYFRHYLMYKYAFTKKVRLNFKVENADMTPSTSANDLAGEIVTETGTEEDPSAVNGDAPSATGMQEEIPASGMASLSPQPTETQEVDEKSTTSGPAVTETSPSEDSAQAQHPVARLTPQEIAAAELRNLVMSTLQPKLDEMKAALMAKLSSHEDMVKERIKKIGEEEEKVVAASNGGGASGGSGSDKKKKEDAKTAKAKK